MEGGIQSEKPLTAATCHVAAMHHGLLRLQNDSSQEEEEL